MKNFSLITLTLALGFILSFTGCSSNEAKAPAKSVAMEKMGFFTVDTCAAAGQFRDCYLENYACGSEGCFEKVDSGIRTPVNLVLYSHDEGKIYKTDLSSINPSEIDSIINRNEVTIIGNYNEDTNTIVATEVKGPPPPKKSFFKGCL